MADPQKRRALGRGIDSLLPAAPPSAGTDTFRARIEDLHPAPRQPRSHFDENRLQELAESLRDKGMLQQIVVRKRAKGGYEIVAGERRWRAAQRAGMREVPVTVVELTDKGAFEAALVENLHRDDLNALDAARAFQRALDELQHTQDSLAKLIGKDRSTVANALRLLKLPEAVLDQIASQQLTEGHGRALLAMSDPALIEKLARQAIAKGWSVRETERRARKAADSQPGGAKAGRAGVSANTRDLEERLTRSLGVRVTIADRKGHGHLSIAFSSYDELDRLISRILTE